MAVPKYTIDLVVDQVALGLDDAQYQNLIKAPLIHLISFYMSHEFLLRDRFWLFSCQSSASFAPGKSIRKSLRVICCSNCSLGSIAYGLRSVLPPDVQRQYLGLYIKSKKQALSTSERDEFDKLERKLNYDNIWSSRLIGQAQLAKGKEKVRHLTRIDRSRSDFMVLFLGPRFTDIHWPVRLVDLQLRFELALDGEAG